MYIEKSAKLSDDGLYRYELRRIWGQNGSLVLFILLNPSTADGSTDDRTTKRCEEFARKWKKDGYLLANLFAYRSTDPQKLQTVEDPVGPKNDSYIINLQKEASLVVCGWGDNTFNDRHLEVMKLLKDPQCLALTRSGNPRHPLARGVSYIPPDTKPIPFSYKINSKR